MARVGRGRLMGVLLLVEDGLDVGCDDESVARCARCWMTLPEPMIAEPAKAASAKVLGAKVSRLCAPQLRVLADQCQRNERRYVRAVSVRLCLRRVFMVCGLFHMPLGRCQTIVWHLPDM